MSRADMDGVRLWIDLAASAQDHQIVGAALCESIEDAVEGGKAPPSEVFHNNGDGSAFDAIHHMLAHRTGLERRAALEALQQIAAPFFGADEHLANGNGLSLGNGNGSGVGNGNSVTCGNGNDLSAGNGNTSTGQRLIDGGGFGNGYIPVGNGDAVGNGMCAPIAQESSTTVRFLIDLERTEFSRRMQALQVNLNQQKALLRRSIRAAPQSVPPVRVVDIEQSYGDVNFRVRGRVDDHLIEIEQVSMVE